eukprot:2674108-Pyramimonas_sp.AAC.1
MAALEAHECAVCALYADVIGSDIGLTHDTTKQASSVTWIGGGYPYTRLHLDAPAPLGPCPGVTLRPQWLDSRETRWKKDQRKADFYCQGCLRGPFKHDKANTSANGSAKPSAATGSRSTTMGRT